MDEEALNGEVTRLTGKKPIDATKDKSVDAKSLTTYSRPVGLKEKRLNSSKSLRYLYAARGEPQMQSGL